jgi:pectate lyase
MYADDSTLCTSATTASQITASLNKDLQSVVEWETSNKLVLNISKIKSNISGINHSIKPKLNCIMKNVEIEQVEQTKTAWCNPGL